MNISMRYNPYKVETQLWINSENLMDTTKFGAFKHDRLQVWVERLFPMLVEELNEDAFFLEFIGTLVDFEDIQQVKNLYPNIELVHIPVEENNDKFKQLEELVQMMKEGPFEQLKDEKIEVNFQRALQSEFEIAVIATMSSGKSTLINAILGQDLMPSKNEACTAKVSRIKNNPNIENYSAVAYSENGQILKIINNARVEDFNLFNNDPEIHLIEIEGNIPYIKSGKMNLVLVDTPGPNNAMDGSHRQHTLSVIKSDDKPMVLYVLNATSLRTDDDLALLRTVADSMAVGGKQSKDRFIFAMNKSDEFDPEKGESISGALIGVKEYLEQQGIENPNIYPVSAQIAKVIRKKKNGYNLTRSENADYFAKDLFLEEPTMHLNQYAPLSPSLRNSIENQILKSSDEDQRVVHYSGITSIEATINEYLEKYAITSKITNAVNTFQRIVEQEDMNNKLKQAILEDSEQREEIARIIKKIKKELNSGNKAQEFKTRIQNMELIIDDFFVTTNKKVFKLLSAISKKLRSNEKIKKYEAELLLAKAQKDVLMMQDDLVTDLEVTISNVLHSTAEQYVNEYRTYIQGVTNFISNSIKLNRWDKALTGDSVDVDDLMGRFSYEEQEVVGTKTVINPDRTWYTFWRPKYIERNVYGNVEYVSMKNLSEEFLLPIEEQVTINIEDAIKFTQAELKRLQEFFISEIDRLEEILKDRVNEIDRLANQHEQLEEQLVENREKQKWLDQFIEKLDAILELKEKAGVNI
ncbi:dynamin family protein [Bacillus sp. AG4(2022)]|uniref:dynamin family protein n=1 Tax=Bacillus sp. AG4(2022) TaxID=2962594 RepID=UPI0028827834|nr:dynamin family protein [Bacillus sp. AG4(2022)]MDT0160663.1 dynamin family protein [Bacillus sp. AG4(2022)]